MMKHTETKNIKYATCEFYKKSLEEDDKYFYFEGYASTFGNIDLVNEVIMPGAFKDSLLEKMPKLLYQHDSRQVLGTFPVCYEDDKGLFVRGRMPKNNSQCRDVYALLECGAIDSMSIGFYLQKFIDKDDTRYIEKVSLPETSLVTFPANPKAIVTSVKSLEEISSLKDIENFLKFKCGLKKVDRATLVSKFKNILAKRDVEPDKTEAQNCDGNETEVKLDETLLIKKLNEFCELFNKTNLSELTHHDHGITSENRRSM